MIIHADCVEAMQAMEPDSIDAIVCDPPYMLGFMGKAWDTLSPGDIQHGHDRWATEALRVLKPGGHLLAFGGTRTYHRLACAVEDAGFEIRDSLIWIYGSGFPKSLDVSKAIDKAAGAEREVVGRREYADGTSTRDTAAVSSDKYGEFAGGGLQTAPATPEAQHWQGWGTALKPAHEPIVVARKPLVGTVAANVLEHGTGALNIDGCRIAMAPGDGANFREERGQSNGKNFASEESKPLISEQHPSGRWPANVTLSPEAAEELDRQSGELRARGNVNPTTRNGESWFGADGNPGVTDSGDTGGASRFFATFNQEEGACLTPDPANTAARTSSPSSEPDASVPSDAATSAHPGDTSENGPGPSPQCKGSTPQPNDLTQTPSPADAGSQGSTDTTPITPGPNLSSGSAPDVTPGNTANDDTGSVGDPNVCRFLYQAKASRAERNAGLEGFEERQTRGNYGDGIQDARPHTAEGYEYHATTRNSHPTVKPIALMRWLVRLVTPKGGTVLDPFTGSGSTGVAAVLEGFDFVGIEREAEYVALAEARVKFWAQFPGADVDKVLLSDARAQVHRSAGQDSLFVVEEAPPKSGDRDGEPTAEQRYTTDGSSNFAMKPGRRRRD